MCCSNRYFFFGTIHTKWNFLQGVKVQLHGLRLDGYIENSFTIHGNQATGYCRHNKSCLFLIKVSCWPLCLLFISIQFAVRKLLYFFFGVMYWPKHGYCHIKTSTVILWYWRFYQNYPCCIYYDEKFIGNCGIQGVRFSSPTRDATPLNDFKRFSSERERERESLPALTWTSRLSTTPRVLFSLQR